MPVSRIATVLGTGAAALALAMAAPAGASAAPAPADALPTYTCEFTTVEPPTADGRFCTVSNGAPEQGPARGPFIITSPDGTPVTCKFGVANAPESVRGFGCDEA
ncbi:hypothetical protein [Streptomyces sp. NPDC048445]|uniref:hypothetical protein n=1 Tax=Streptomyces sp. NPDC048445 TaxID=3365553 RepID=UPI003723024B